MGFFDALKRALGGPEQAPATATPRPGGLNDAWGLTDDPDAAEASGYDREQWSKKLKRVLTGLPDTKGEWPDLEAEARALDLDPAWVLGRSREEFKLLVRRAVADRKFTDAEHRTLDLARDLIGMPDAEAEATLHAVVAEAEQFFGGSVEGA